MPKNKKKINTKAAARAVATHTGGGGSRGGRGSRGGGDGKAGLQSVYEKEIADKGLVEIANDELQVLIKEMKSMSVTKEKHLTALANLGGFEEVRCSGGHHVWERIQRKSDGSLEKRGPTTSSSSGKSAWQARAKDFMRPEYWDDIAGVFVPKER